jgi:prepilin-type N-terminal cleavage/methylation domain-containing protein
MNQTGSNVFVRKWKRSTMRPNLTRLNNKFVDLAERESVVVSDPSALQLDNSSQRKTCNTGFTLVELLVVIAIIGILVSLLLPAVQAAREAARRTQCTSNLRQVALAISNYESGFKRFPSGWTDNVQPLHPGWSWSHALLPFMEQSTLHGQIDSRFPVVATVNQSHRLNVIPTYLCPSDPGESTFEIGSETDEAEEEEHIGHNVDEGPKLFRIAKCNYVGVFGTLEIEEHPYRSDGVFFGNSMIRPRDIVDGLSHTLVVGERSSRLGGSVWHGWVDGAADPGARFLGTADHVPNSPVGHFDDFSSLHGSGTHFVNGDCSTRLISNSIEHAIYQAMATRHGAEVVSTDE